MAGEPDIRILSLNGGSSSLKFALYELGSDERLVLSGGVRGIGTRGTLTVVSPTTGVLVDRPQETPDHEAAVHTILAWLDGHGASPAPDALGHRVVHGGSRHRRAELIDDRLLDDLTRLVPLAPDHLPSELRIIRTARRAYGGVPHVACFDTSFHRSMPEIATLYPLPRELADEGILRYGFHGLSCEYITTELRRIADPAADGRVIVAHLGSGASMTAVRGGRSVDTTMGFTPASGLTMSTRAGDLDPGIIVHLLRRRGWDAGDVNELVNQRSGLLGVSGISADMRELLRLESGEPRAALAIELFCHLARKQLGALAAVLGGLDTLVFTAGIGENAPTIRQRICQGLEHLGVRLDRARNEAGEAIISASDAPVRVRVMATNEELMVARHVRSVLRGRPT